jgi:hypothetical protein
VALLLDRWVIMENMAFLFLHLVIIIMHVMISMFSQCVRDVVHVMTRACGVNFGYI